MIIFLLILIVDRAMGGGAAPSWLRYYIEPKIVTISLARVNSQQLTLTMSSISSFEILPLPSQSYIENAQRSLSSSDPRDVTLSAQINSRKSIVPEKNFDYLLPCELFSRQIRRPPASGSVRNNRWVPTSHGRLGNYILNSAEMASGPL